MELFFSHLHVFKLSANSVTLENLLISLHEKNAVSCLIQPEVPNGRAALPKALSAVNIERQCPPEHNSAHLGAASPSGDFCLCPFTMEVRVTRLLTPASQ